MEWFKKHTDAVIVLGGIVACMLWMNTQFNSIDNRFAQLEKDVAIIKTVLVMQKIMPSEIASKEK